ncbi:MAG: glycerol-3-phosphate dehydrogenase [Rhodospirillaceae bacterium]|jgi:glycerol-3-phosphate dehydrogenase subunit C|nr:glycerol-3-phosphate dehydrogenase [Rhodospirillaceae bacterium]MBT3883389.1 glycerol-3-phosphate dehydrogenase [Rhodospirillaceae bacterium]MBT4115781.1 glycerol-3-phosphate dehydrogenase [Rhodospirillaceae bacterium]MBT4674503.1 glycerol-3-phosphate dehydrogenase [Rhodospirillaceae bacterium]MBT4719109.1 glycerol-3-phosphate dehydrogenase [Rhodospirillaceae bacterium]
MGEGSLEAPTRHKILWRDADFTDADKLDVELRRVFDICHGCRRCFNLCISFPKLFDLIDDSASGELDTVASKDFQPIIDGCTLCDMCFMTKCPYVPPHEFDLDFPHLMLRARVKDFQDGKVGTVHRRLVETDRNGKLAGAVPALANWASQRGNGLTRAGLSAIAGIHKDAELPQYHGRTFAKLEPPEVNRDAPAFGRKAALYATCFVNYNNPQMGAAAAAVLARNGVEAVNAYKQCCGMPQLEQGDIGRVAENAKVIAADLVRRLDDGYDIVALVPSCALMMKFEWPLIEPDDANVKRLAEAVKDITEYVVDIAETEGLAPGLAPLDGAVSLHFACHARAQNMGPKAQAMLRLIPDAEVSMIERCSGHGGSWGVMKDNFEAALKVGRPAARQSSESGAKYVVSECPLARDHILQGREKLDSGAGDADVPPMHHPIQLLAHAYGIKHGE